MRHSRALLCSVLVATAAACGAETDDVSDESFKPCEPEDGDNLMVTAEACAEDPKADTGYVTNLNAREMELTLEGDVEAAYDKERAPLVSGQFALTFFRQKKDLYIQSLAEDYANGGSQTDWKVGTAWKKWSAMTTTERNAAKHFRLTTVNAVLMNASKYAPAEGKTFAATVPLKPISLFSDVGRKCEGGDGHIQADSGVYWYVWDPSKSTCTATKTTVTATITKLLPKGGTVYPEYDKLYADKKLETIVFFGQVDDDPLTPQDSAFEEITEFENMLKAASFKKGTAAKGARWTRLKNGVTAIVDIYSPNEFKGLTDNGNLTNFLDAVKTHEVVIFNGHSVLGASDFWADSRIYSTPTKYQIFLYNGCLGYEYYVAPILKGKLSPANVDVISNVVETPFAIVTDVSALAITGLLAGAPKATSSWQTILGKINSKAAYYADWAGPSFFGVSGARTNTYKPR